MPFATVPDRRWLASIDGLTTSPFWTDRPSPAPCPAATGVAEADLVVIGGGFTGLWAALEARRRDSGRDVMLLEGDTVASAASGRNGGFVAASITHGLANGMARWPGEIRALHRLGMENLDAIEQTVMELSIACDWQRTGELVVAVEPHQARDLVRLVESAGELGIDLEWLDAEAARSIVDSPTYLGAVRDQRGVAMADPARLAWGLRQAALDAGIRLHEGTWVTGIRRRGSGVEIRTADAGIRARRVLLATGAHPSLLRRVRPYIVPVYDYVLVTEPLSGDQRTSIRWEPRLGVSDAGNLFHYYRMTEDGRILWGGYDAVHHWRNRMGPQFDADHDCFARLADHFFATFPQLAGLRFTHGWGGAIDTCSRFSPFWGTALDGRLAYVAGFTGLGVGASRFGAITALDLVDGDDTERTRLQMVRRGPLPFPPEPLRSAGIAIMKRSLETADRNGGRRNGILRAADALGLGFDS